MATRGRSFDMGNAELGDRDGSPGRYGRLRLLSQGADTFHAKTKQQFQCLDCGAGSEGGWSMQFHNVSYGRGCPICASTDGLPQRIAAQWPQYRLVIEAPRQGVPLPEDIRFCVVPERDPFPEDFRWRFLRLTRAAIMRGLRLDERPGRGQDGAYQIAVDAHRHWNDMFGAGGDIRYAGPKKLGSTSPGPFFAIDTGDRLMRSRIKEAFISADGLLAICEQERKDRSVDARWRSEATRFGATIVGYEHSNALGVRIRYRNRFGRDREDSYSRAVETNWGQTKMRKGESLCAIVLGLLFPSDDWRSNSRPEFLIYRIADREPSRLELDGYSPALKLAFEYQGDHHYHARDEDTGAQLTLAEIQARDAYKVVTCADRGLTLLVVPEMDLDPALFLARIRSICIEHGRTPECPDVRLDAVWEQWNAWCQNPLADFQNKIVEQLSAHRLVSPDKVKIGKTSLVRYQCGNCGEMNETLAKHLREGAPRKGCPHCRSEIAGQTRVEAGLREWEASSGLPRSFIDNLRTHSVSGETRYICERDASHIVAIHDLAFARRHVIDGRFVCPHCESETLGVGAHLVALQRQWNRDLADDLEALGLSVVETRPPTNGQATAVVDCRTGTHRFEVTRAEASAMLKNECLNDRAIVPSACYACCYPGDGHTGVQMRSTVFHRLYVLRGMYPRADYIDGFDPTGWGQEVFSCGKQHADGTAHSPIRASFRNLRKASRRAPASHWCVACGFEKGQMVGGGKTLEDLVSLMKAMRSEIGRLVPLPEGCVAPTVQWVSGPMAGNGEVSTTKTRLAFHCGVPGHAAVTATKDYYFNRAEQRGAGFCPACVKLVGRKKAPIPIPAAEDDILRICAMRD